MVQGCSEIMHTTFIKLSNPRRMPVTFRFPLIFIDKCLSMYLKCGRQVSNPPTYRKNCGGIAAVVRIKVSAYRLRSGPPCEITHHVDPVVQPDMRWNNKRSSVSSGLA